MFLSSCFWSWDESSSERWLESVEWPWFSIEVPSNWSELASNDFPIPKSGELVYAIASSEERNNYLNNLVVLRADEKTDVSSSSLVQSSIWFLEQNMLNFNLIEQKDITFLDETSWSIAIFSARYNTQTPTAYYLQTARNCSEGNFFVTLSLAEEVESFSPYEYILKTLNCN